MLEEREQRILREIESELSARDPRLASRIGSVDRTSWLRSWWWPCTALGAGLVIGVFLMTLGLVGNALLLISVAAVPVARRWWQRPRHVARRDRRPG